ncbi:hypothetical protein NKW84_07015 [Acetobacter senegalensis]|uniref:hypothetical protein n=1 Tax=Acetobacter senegalensis TaxID=446692 RepID=UPI00209F7381|nr:hypothetical protein [Acetobacter senegalensis]MCP1195607.1 hypothetical protein [Acetobacter senegalensis]
MSDELKKYISLKSHREQLQKNPRAYTIDLKRCYSSVKTHLRKCGASLSSRKKPKIQQNIITYVDLIFLAQDKKPFFYINSELPLCWNVPHHGGWDLDYIKYEWGHLYSINQNREESHSLENLCLQSGRCNQHIQSSLNVSELSVYGGKLRETIERNLDSRERLFKTEEWKKVVDYLLS